MSVRKWPVPREGSMSEILPLIKEYHPYKSAGKVGKVFVCEVKGEVLAGFLWLPPPPGAAKKVSPGEPSGALCLSRMVGVPKVDRDWHLSKPLKFIMKKALDRERYPVLVTYADTGEGHTGHVYKCSSWVKDAEVVSKKYRNNTGERVSVYRGGRMVPGMTTSEESVLIRFVHRVCPKGEEGVWMRNHGWTREPAGGFWRSGNPKMKWVKNG